MTLAGGMTREHGRITFEDETDGMLKDAVDLAIPVEEDSAAPPRGRAIRRVIGVVALIAMMAGLIAGFLNAGSGPGAPPSVV